MQSVHVRRACGEHVAIMWRQLDVAGHQHSLKGVWGCVFSVS